MKRCASYLSLPNFVRFQTNCFDTLCALVVLKGTRAKNSVSKSAGNINDEGFLLVYRTVVPLVGRNLL